MERLPLFVTFRRGGRSRTVGQNDGRSGRFLQGVLADVVVVDTVVFVVVVGGVKKAFSCSFLGCNGWLFNVQR